MAGLATILAERGTIVSGSDMVASAYTRQVQARGGTVFIGHDAVNLPEQAEVVVHSAAVPPDNPELEAARKRGIRCVVRGRFLAELAESYPCVIAVGGSHGKTTTTAFIAHILKRAGLQPGYLVGGEIDGWSASAAAGRGAILVTEVDESDGTQAFMRSTYGLVINVEDDHCWNLGGIEALRECFRTFAGNSEHLVAWQTEQAAELFENHPECTFLDADAIPADLKLRVPGKHNRINATLAMTVARMLGVTKKSATRALSTFNGVKRRMTHHFTTADGRISIVEDYAHHPTELAVTLEALRESYPEHKLVAVFQPHRFERVKRYADEFSRLLGSADDVVVVRPFAAWLDDGSAVRPETIAEQIDAVPVTYWRDAPSDLGRHLAVRTAQTETNNAGKIVFAILGAGDVCEVIPTLEEELTVRILDAFEKELHKRCPNCVAHRLGSWADYTTLGIGSAKPLVVEPADVTELRHVLRVSKRQNLPVFYLGKGSNVVGTDRLMQQVVIRPYGPAFTSWSRHGRFIRAGAGVSLTKLIHELADIGLLPARATPLGWIPGAAGGAVRMNAGADGVQIGNFIDRVTGMDRNGRNWEKKGSEIHWGYRETNIPEDVCLTEVLLSFGEGNRDAALAALRSSGEKRRREQPRGRTAGCAFRNAGEASAGKILDAAGCKGLRVGNCRISTKHANFLIASRGATEDDYVTLLRLAQQKVMNRFNIILKPEVVFVNPASSNDIESNIATPHIAVLQGGPSSEHDVSLRSAAAVAKALREAGLKVTQVDVPEARLPRIPADADIVFPVLHGTFGEDGGIQTLLEEKGHRYVGSGAEASAATMSKIISKRIFNDQDILTPGFQIISSADGAVPDGMEFPLIVKPVNQGSTHGLTLLKRYSGWWKRSLKAAFAVDSEVMVEDFVKGVEITVGLLEGEPLPVIEIVPPKGRIFDYDAKYMHSHGHTHYFCPPKNISAKIQKRAQKLAVRVYHALDAKDMLRVDMIVDNEGAPWVLEANSIPGFTSTSLLPMAARQAGITFPELCARLVKGAAAS